MTESGNIIDEDLVGAKSSTKSRPSSGGGVQGLSKVGLGFRNSFQVRRNSVGGDKYTAAIEAVNSHQQEDSMTTLETIRLDLKKALASSWWGQLYENIVAIISVLSSLEFIYQTYLTEDRRQNQYAIAKVMELSFAFLFGADWVLSLFLADHAFTFIISFYSLIDIFTVVSIICTYSFDKVEYGMVESPFDVVIYALYGLKTVRILRALWFNKKLTKIEDAVDRYVGEMSLSISLMILFFSAVVQYFEDEVQPYPFHTWTYYIWVTIATVGYGDITPQTTAGRLFVMLMIGVAIVSIPKMTNELIEKMSLQSFHMRAVYTPKSRNSKHVIICGDLSSTSLKEFFSELFHEDHDNTDLHAVILLPQAPTVELLLLMRQPQFVLSLTYLEGSALVEADLIRAKAETAMAIFIMTNKFSPFPDEEDAKSILLNLSIKKYLENFQRSNMLYCMQLIRPENKRHLTNDDFFDALEDNDLVVCLNEIKMGAIAKAVMYPGANTLLMNLVSSFSDEDLNEEVAENFLLSPRVDPDGNQAATNQTPPKEWIKEYMKGCGWEIYTTTLSRVFAGAKFVELSYALYDKIGVVLFALQISDISTGQTKILLNPHDYIIPEQEKYKIEAFVIAMNKASSDLSFGEGQGGRQSAVELMNKNLGSIANIVKSSVKDYRPSAEVGGRKMLNRKVARKLAAVNAISHTNSSSSSISVAGSGATGASPTTAQPAITKKSSLWSKLKRSELLKKKVENHSYQEVLHRMEDKHFSENYYIRKNFPDLFQCTVKTSVIDELPLIRNHLIIIGKSLKNLLDLIKPLRAKYLGPLRYIVIVHPVDIPDDVWQRICVFDSVLFVRGSPLEESHLRRAGIFRAAQVVVLADGSLNNNASAGMEALVDSDAIFTYQHVKRMSPSTQVVIEIVNQTNIAYLEKDSNQLTNHDFKFSPQFASGVLFTTSLLDSIICQTYYNPQIIKVMNKLISGVDQAERANLAADAAREVFNNGGHESEENRIKFQKTLSPINDIKGSCLYQINLPEGLEKKTYGALFQHLSTQGMIPLGLLRGTFTNINMGPKANRTPYVFTNPDKDTELYGCDRVFVLSPTPFQTSGPTSIVDWVVEIQQQLHNKHELATGYNSGQSRPVSGVDRNKEITEKQFIKLNYRMDRLFKDVNRQFQELRTILGAPETSHDRLNRSKSEDESGSESGFGSPKTPIVRKRSTSHDDVSDDASSRSTIKTISSRDDKVASNTLAGILRKKSLSSDVPKKTSSFSEPVVSQVALFKPDDNSTLSVLQRVQAALNDEQDPINRGRIKSRSRSQDADDENSDDSDGSESRCTVIEEEEKGPVLASVSSMSEQQPAGLPTKYLVQSVDSVSSLESLDGAKIETETQDMSLLDTSNISESDVVKHFEVKVKPTTTSAELAMSPKRNDKSNVRVHSAVEGSPPVIGPSLTQITATNARPPVNRNIQLNSSNHVVVIAPVDGDRPSSSSTSSSVAGNPGVSVSKAQRVALEQALKNPEMFTVDVASNNLRQPSVDDDTIADDDRSIITVDSKSVPPGPTIDMVYKVMHRGVVAEKI